PARDRRPHPPSAREARAAAGPSAAHHHRPRDGLSLPRAMRSALGLRPRLLAALLATSAVTLVAAALTLLPPLRDRLRDQSVHNTRRATSAQLAGFESALRRHDCDELARLLGQLAQQTGANVYLVD